jgi:FMN phosphatase YigB (HAD superfamily)
MSEKGLWANGPVIFDLDGVIVDNVDFEMAVTEHLVSRLSRLTGRSLVEARKMWMDCLSHHRNHPRWHDYGFHCQQLGLGNAWMEAHLLCRSRLKLMPGIESSLSSARRLGARWIASDATDWVVQFKLSSLGLRQSEFAETFTVDRCHSHKGEPSYWCEVRRQLPGTSTSPIYIDNRLDRLHAAKTCFSACLCIWVDTSDHPISMGFVAHIKGERFRDLIATGHSQLAAVLAAVNRENSEDK